MVLGQSAGCAAAMAIDQVKTVQEIEYSGLRKTLLEKGQILEIPENWLETITSYN
jgi:hypothetical protein